MLSKKQFIEYADEFGFVEAIAELPCPTFSEDALREVWKEKLNKGEMALEESGALMHDADYFLLFNGEYCPVNDTDDVLEIPDLFKGE